MSPAPPPMDAVFDLLEDARLSREARIMGARLARLGDGEHEVSTEEWQVLLGRSPRGGAPKRQTIAGYASELEMFGWIERSGGGRGSPRYRFLRSPSGTVEPEGAPDSTVPQGVGRVLQSPRGSVDGEFYSPPGVPERASTVPQGDARARGSSSSYTEAPPPPPLDVRVENALGSDDMRGVRGSLRDYILTGRPERPYAYVQSVAAALQGANPDWWVTMDGGQYRGEKAPIIAGALNELMQGDEIGRYFPGPPGDIANLRAKVRHKVKTISGAELDAKKAAEAVARDTTNPRRTGRIRMATLPDEPEAR